MQQSSMLHMHLSNRYNQQGANGTGQVAPQDPNNPNPTNPAGTSINEYSQGTRGDRTTRENTVNYSTGGGNAMEQERLGGGPSVAQNPQVINSNNVPRGTGGGTSTGAEH